MVAFISVIILASNIYFKELITFFKNFYFGWFTFSVLEIFVLGIRKYNFL